MAFLELAKERFSCRKFSDRIVEEDKIDKIIKAGLLAPTAVNKQPFKIFKVKSDSIEKLKKATPFTFNAKTFLIIGTDFQNSYVRSFDNKNFAEIDATIAATHMMLEIQDLGLGTTWVGHFDEKILKAEFPQLANYTIVAIFPIGYPAEDAVVSPMHSVSKTKDEIIELI